MSAPRTKRQFAGAASDPAQRQITSYFCKSPNGSGSGNSDPAVVVVPVTSPPLPSNIQSNLLSVGMRVRKSVPEGYKTGSSFGGFSLWADADADNNDQPSSAFQRNNPLPARPSRQELLPFCGIHKIGGFATQPETNDHWSLPPSAFSVDDADDNQSAVPALNDVPSLTSSQESAASVPAIPTLSVIPPPPASRKRFFADEDEGDVATAPAPFAKPMGLGVWRDRGEWLDGEVSPRSLAPAGWENARVMAVPRRQRWKKAQLHESLSGAGGVGGGPALSLADLGQENMALDDFAEADFLDRQYETDMEIE